jgi:hypothetical protein
VDPDWIRIQRLCGSGLGIRIPDPGARKSGSGLSKNAGSGSVLNQSGSATLTNGDEKEKNPLIFTLRHKKPHYFDAAGEE